jgi:ubiquinone/menaquinone biosynthesis C-methylase UbiE
MAVFETLTPAERARQLSNPEGDVGRAVADWLNETNKAANTKTVSLLGLTEGNHVLEIGFGNGRTVPDVIGQAADIRYTGIDISPTMVAEASRFNAALVAAGRARFHLGSAEHMPFAGSVFDRVFSTGVIHFWAEPGASLGEVQRVMRPGGVMVMGCLAPRDPPDFARPEYGVHLRDAAEWDALCRDAGFVAVNVEMLQFEQITPNGPTKRHTFRVTARA